MLSTFPTWFKNIVQNKTSLNIDGNIIKVVDSAISCSQEQTAESFGYQWSRRDLFDQARAHTQVREWLIERFGLPEQWIKEDSILLDAGCGAGQSILGYVGEDMLSKVHYIGCDISSAVEMAQKRFKEKNIKNAVFIRSDINSIPLIEETVDIIFSEGVLHHTDNARKSFSACAKLLKKGGIFIFYIYKKKAPIREFTDDFIREQLIHLSPEEKFVKLLPLTRLGQILGDVNVQIKLDEPIDILGIPAGEINVQRLFFYYIFKCFYKPDWTLEQMNLTNFDWYSPQNCSRHTSEEVREWFKDEGFEVEREYIDDSGLSYIVRKK